MKINNEQFYVVRTPTADHYEDTEQDAIDALKAHGDDIDPENDDVTVAQISYSDSDWEIKELPWQQIALQLLQ